MSSKITQAPLDIFHGGRSITGKSHELDYPYELAEIIRELQAAHNKDIPISHHQATAASLDIDVMIAQQDGTIESFKAVSGATAAAGESMTVDVQIGGVSALTAAITLDAAATTVVQSGTIDTAANSFSAGDIISIVRVYTAGGGPTPMVNTLATAGISMVDATS